MLRREVLSTLSRQDECHCPRSGFQTVHARDGLTLGRDRPPRSTPLRFFFPSPSRSEKPLGKQPRLHKQVVALRKQNLSIHDISRALAIEGESAQPSDDRADLEQDGFGSSPDGLDDERPDRPRPVIADVADVRQLDLTARSFRTKFGGLFLFLPYLISARLDSIVTRCGLPGSKMVPAACALRSLLGLKLFGNARHSHVMSSVLDEGLALFAGLNVVPKRSFLHRIQLPHRADLLPDADALLVRCG